MQQLFYQSCVSGDTDTVKKLLTPPVMDALTPPSVNPNLCHSVLLYNYGIQIACKHHHTEMVKLLLEYKPMVPYIDFTMSNCFAFFTICKEGYDDIVRIILHFNQAQLKRYLPQCINLAWKHSQHAVIRVLETPRLFQTFIMEPVMDYKVALGMQLLSYQDCLMIEQRKHAVQFMTAYFSWIFPLLPRDIVTWICQF